MKIKGTEVMWGAVGAVIASLITGAVTWNARPGPTGPPPEATKAQLAWSAGSSEIRRDWLNFANTYATRLAEELGCEPNDLVREATKRPDAAQLAYTKIKGEYDVSVHDGGKVRAYDPVIHNPMLRQFFGSVPVTTADGTETTVSEYSKVGQDLKNRYLQAVHNAVIAGKTPIHDASVIAIQDQYLARRQSITEACCRALKQWHEDRPRRWAFGET